MAGTRGMVQFKTPQLSPKLMRDSHFDLNNKINEDKIDILWHNHREILQDTKVDVFVQVNDKDVSEMSGIDITSELSGYSESTAEDMEGIRLDKKVIIRKDGTEDTPIADADGDVVYGKIEKVDTTYTLNFYSMVDGVEAAFTMPAETAIDFRFVLRTNLGVLPVDAIINGGAGFVEGATDAKAYLNLQQLMKDIYGGIGSLDNDGEANLAISVIDQIADLINDLASTDAGKGAQLVGVVTNQDYAGATVQDVLNDLAARLVAAEGGGLAEVEASHTREADSANGYFTTKELASLEERLVEIESVVDAQAKDKEDRVTELETEDDRLAFEVTAQVESITIGSGATTDGDVTVTITAAGMTGSPKAVTVAVLTGDDAPTVAGKVRTALVDDTDVSGFFTVSGTGADIVLTTQEVAITDATMNIAVTGGTTGVPDVVTSTTIQEGTNPSVVNLPDGKVAKDNSLFVTVQGAIQAPGINYEEITDESGVIGITFAPEVLTAGYAVFMWWKNK